MCRLARLVKGARAGYLRVYCLQEHFWIHNHLIWCHSDFEIVEQKYIGNLPDYILTRRKVAWGWDYMRPLYWLVHFDCMHVNKSHGNLPAKNYRYPTFLPFVVNKHGGKLSLVHIVCGCSVQKSNIILLCISTPLPHSKCCSAELPLLGLGSYVLHRLIIASFPSLHRSYRRLQYEKRWEGLVRIITWCMPLTYP